MAKRNPDTPFQRSVPGWTKDLAKRMDAPMSVVIYKLPGSTARIIANLKLKLFEIKHLPLSIMSRMMADIAKLGND